MRCPAGNYDSDKIQQLSPWFGPFFFISFDFLVAMVLINVLLAILVDTYTRSLKALLDPESLIDQIRRIFKHFWSSFRARSSKGARLQDLFDILNLFEAEDADGFTFRDLVSKLDNQSQIDRFQTFLKPMAHHPRDEEAEMLRSLLAQQALYRTLSEENSALNARLYQLECLMKERSEKAKFTSPREKDKVCFSERNQLRVFSNDLEDNTMEPRAPCEDDGMPHDSWKPDDQPENFLGFPLSSLGLSLQLPTFNFRQLPMDIRSSLFEVLVAG